MNILRDLPADLKNGRCYLPWKNWSRRVCCRKPCCGRRTSESSCRCFREHLDKAEAHLAAGWRYTNTLPFGQFRVRLACAWPILIGVKTLEKLRVAT